MENDNNTGAKVEDINEVILQGVKNRSSEVRLETYENCINLLGDQKLNSKSALEVLGLVRKKEIPFAIPLLTHIFGLNSVKWDGKQKFLGRLAEKLLILPDASTMAKVDNRELLREFSDTLCKRLHDFSWFYLALWEQFASAPNSYHAHILSGIPASKCNLNEEEKLNLLICLRIIFARTADWSKDRLIWLTSVLHLPIQQALELIYWLPSTPTNRRELNNLFKHLKLVTLTTKAGTPGGYDGDVFHVVFFQKTLHELASHPKAPLKWALIESNIEWMLDIVFKTLPPSCPQKQQGKSQCGCSSSLPFRNTVCDVIFETVANDKPKVLLPYTKLLLRLYERHPTTECLIAIKSVYPLKPAPINERIDLFVDFLQKMETKTEMFHMLRLIALTGGESFKPEYLTVVEKYLLDPEEKEAICQLALDLLSVIAENNPGIFVGMGEDYYGALEKMRFSEGNLFAINKIIAFRGTASSQEAGKCLNLLLQATERYPMRSLKEDVVQRMQFLATVHPKAVKVHQHWIKQCIKDPTLRHSATKLLLMLGIKDTGFSACRDSCILV